MPAEPSALKLHNRVGRWLSLAFLLTVVLSMGLSGWFALDEGRTRFLLPFTTDTATAQVRQAVAAARAHPDLASLRQVSEETWALSAVTSPQRFADSRIMEQGIYYTTMPRPNQILMAVHVLFGVFCLLVGGLQFWPGFRKRFMKVHRIIGMIYVVTVPISVVTVLAYMALTPPHHIYAHLVAWVALWVFGVLALVAITMALRALQARRIFEHQAWMALSFGCLIVAPLLRLDWVLLAWLFPAIDQETLNLVTMGLMLPETLLIAYGLILVNRQYARPLRQRAAAAPARLAAAGFLKAVPALLLLALVLLGINAWRYGAATGMSGLEAASRLVPTALLQREQAVLAANPLTCLLFALGLGLAFPAAVLTLRKLLQASQDQAPDLAALAPVTALLAMMGGVAAVVLGWQISLAPHNAWLSGGTLYTVNGLVIAGFGLLLLAAHHAGQRALMKESLVFLLCLLPFPTLFFATLQVMASLPVPADYIAAGQGFVLPVGFSGGLLFLAMFYVVYGQATREHN